MRTLHLWNRHDLKQLAQGVEFTFKIGDEVHTHRAEHAYKRGGNGNGASAEVKPLSSTSPTGLSDKAKRAIVKRLDKERRVDIARDIGVSATTIGAWAKKYRGGK